MLDEFITTHRETIIARARARVASRVSPKPTDLELTNGIPVFLDQLAIALRLAKSTDAIEHENISASAGRHGRDLLAMGLTVGQVVHDYGDVCQVITALAIDEAAPLAGEEFRTLNLCLDDAIAGAVSEYGRQRERLIVGEGTERLGILAHEMRNLLNLALLSYDGIRSGHVAAGGSTGLILGRSLTGLRNLIDRSLAEVRIDANIGHHELISVAQLIEEVEIGSQLQAEARHLRLEVVSVDPSITIEGDRQIIAAAISNLLQNAFKFTRAATSVSLKAHATADRVFIDVADECGGLPPGKAEELFRPFEQRGDDRRGVGLGLSISRKAALSNGGELRVRDVPGVGCVFTLDLPRRPPPPLALIDGGLRGERTAPAKKAETK